MNHLCIDIETIPGTKNFDHFPESLQKRIQHKIDKGKERNPGFDWKMFAGLNGDFGRVVCISIGYISNGSIILKSFFGHDEEAILNDFNDAIRNFNGLFIHYNGLNFDVPFILQRLSHHYIPLSNLAFKNLRKFSEFPHYDLMQIYYNWDITRANGLEAFAVTHGMPTPKDALGGDQVYAAYLEDRWDQIPHYCEYDVATTLNGWRIVAQCERPIPLENIRFTR